MSGVTDQGCKISIITINFNNLQGLKKTIRSVICQDYQNIEYIIIDGGSTDGSAEFIQSQQNYISFWVSERDKGIYDAMNKGVKKAIGDYCLFLNSGDCLHNTNSISEFVSQLSGEDLLMGRVRCIPSGRIAYDDISYPFTMLDFYLGSPVPHPACLIRRSLFDNRLYDENLRIVSDWKFFLETIVFDNCSYKIVDTVVSDFEEEGVSSNRSKCNIERENVLREKLPPAILMDYKKLENGKDYKGEVYDMFFSDLRKNNRPCAKMIYAGSVCIVKILSYVYKSLTFSRQYPSRYQ